MGRKWWQMEEELHKGPTVPAMASPASVGTSQADFDALLLEAVIKSQYRVVRLAIESGMSALRFPVPTPSNAACQHLILVSRLRTTHSYSDCELMSL